MAAENLQAGAGAVEGLVGPGRLEHRRDQAAPAAGELAAGGVAVVFQDVQLQRGAVGHDPAGIDPGALGVEDAAHGGVLLDQIGFAGFRMAAGRTHLAAFF
ncbi:hypothetical protein D9M68_943620 [compost metagenome]